MAACIALLLGTTVVGFVSWRGERREREQLAAERDRRCAATLSRLRVVRDDVAAVDRRVPTDDNLLGQLQVLERSCLECWPEVATQLDPLLGQARQALSARRYAESAVLFATAIETLGAR